VCVCVCLLCLIFVCKNCSNSLVDRTHGLVRSILDTIKRRMFQCRFATEISFKFLFCVGQTFHSNQCLLDGKIICWLCPYRRDFASIEDLGYKGASDFKLGTNL
jgi:hypothetical protein